MRRESQPPLEKPSDRSLLEALITLPGSTGETYSRFHNYSPRNLGFLALQGCAPEPVATYGKWQELGRQVRKGEKAYSILRPIQIKIEDESKPHDDPKLIRRFKVVRALFGVSQTDGDDLPPYEPAGWSLDRAIDKLQVRRVPFELYNGNVGGYAVGRDLAINPVAPYPLRTAVHELAHIDLGHTTGDDLADYTAHRGTYEAEAETTAHLTLKEIDALDDETARVSRGYIQGWLGSAALSDLSIRRIMTSSGRIIDAGREPVAD